MSDYAITGKKGAGKTLSAVGIIRDALLEGKRVATNLDIYLDKLLPASSKATLIRLPDYPKIDDLNALGRGQAGVVEEANGILVLDETSHFFNARQYADKARQPVLDWLTQSRKMGWDVYYIMQGLPQMDKQVRETQIEYTVACKNTGKWPIPFLTPLTAVLFGEKKAIRFPAGHFAVTRHGVERDAIIVSRKFYRSRDLYPAYDTQQLFRHDIEVGGVSMPVAGMHSLLSPWHLVGRYQKKRHTIADLLPHLHRLAIYLVLRLCERSMGVDGLVKAVQK